MRRTGRCPTTLITALVAALLCVGTGNAAAAPGDDGTPPPANNVEVAAGTGSAAPSASPTPPSTAPAAGRPAPPTPPVRPGKKPPAEAAKSIVVKINTGLGHTIEEVVAAFPVQVESTVLASRGIYLIRATDPGLDAKKAKELAGKIKKSPAVIYAEPNYKLQLTDTRFHAWPDGYPVGDGSDSAAFLGQPAAQQLRLSEVHASSTGAGQTVAVLDTGVDPTHPAVSGRMVAGYDYVDDDADADERAVRGSATGHGTFVTGIVGLVAPNVRILPMRVLNGDGEGNIFAVTEAVLDATGSAAGVINMSFGVSEKVESKLLADAIKQARKRGTTVVAAAGNDVTVKEEFPAAQPEALGVTALSANGNDLASFANRGKWVDVAAPGEKVVGPLPGGGFAQWAGSSMSTAFVTGQAALLRQKFPQLKQNALMDKVRKTARKLLGGHPFGAADVLNSVQGRAG